MRAPGLLFRLSLLCAGLTVVAAGCEDKKTATPAAKSSPGKGPRPQRPEAKPTFDVATPPSDAETTTSGLVFKSIVEGTGAAPGPNDTAMVNYSAWRPDGSTMTSTLRAGRPVPMGLYRVAPGFREALQKMKKGGKAMFWLPPSIGFRQRQQAKPETIAYEVELVDFEAAPPTPEDVAAPPANAQKLTQGISFTVLAPGTGPVARNYDTVTFHQVGWDSSGKLLESSRFGTRAAKPPTGPLFREAVGVEAVLTKVGKGAKVRAWIPVALLRKTPDMPSDGIACYEFEVLDVVPAKQAPPPPPATVGAPPKDAKKTAKGVSYKVLKSGSGKLNPSHKDSVEVHYTGWTTDGRMFDSSVVRGEPLRFELGGVIPGWTDGVATMVEGEKTLFWIPEELAYKGRPGRPQGMLVFEISLLRINPPPKPGTAPMPQVSPSPHGTPGGSPHGGAGSGAPLQPVPGTSQAAPPAHGSAAPEGHGAHDGHNH